LGSCLVCDIDGTDVSPLDVCYPITSPQGNSAWAVETFSQVFARIGAIILCNGCVMA
jgi:hypothetical protein